MRYLIENINKTWGKLLLIYMLLMITISLLAHLDLLPETLNNIPFHDKIMHFIFSGVLFFLATKAVSGRSLFVGKFSINPALLLALSFIVIEEVLQISSPHRSFSFGDMVASISGVFTYMIIDRFFINRHEYGNKKKRTVFAQSKDK